MRRFDASIQKLSESQYGIAVNSQINWARFVSAMETHRLNEFVWCVLHSARPGPGNMIHDILGILCLFAMQAICKYICETPRSINLTQKHFNFGRMQVESGAPNSTANVTLFGSSVLPCTLTTFEYYKMENDNTENLLKCPAPHDSHKRPTYAVYTVDEIRPTNRMGH